MKRFILFTLFTLFALCNYDLQAQVKFHSSTNGLEMVAKRMSINGDIVTITGTLTWYGKTEAKAFNLSRPEVRIIDDEGDVYTYNNIQIDIANVTILDPGYTLGEVVDLPVGIPLKVTITVFGVNEYATAFSLIEIPYFGNPTANFHSGQFSCRGLQFPVLD